MTGKKINTKHAPAERSDLKNLKRQIKLFDGNEVLKNLSDAISNMLVILNKERQIIYANKQFLEFLKVEDKSTIMGKRLGEAAKCIHANLSSGGCGTSEFCRTCGAINAILESQGGAQSVKECRIFTTENEAMDLRVTATPYTPNGEVFTMFAINDISDEKRRQTLERVFFHDVLNSAGGITGLSGLLTDLKEPNEIAEVAQLINRTASALVEEIEAQRYLSAAERNDYDINYTKTESLAVLKELMEFYSSHEVIKNKKLIISPESENINFETDTTLLRRILGNMVKNALEASLHGETVTLACTKNNNDVQFSAHNNTYIQQETQLQLFKRSFSTKGAGRGIGTYSMKLFGEKYLKGKVWFKSTRENGTTFNLKIPIIK